ncbi:hypothetical protein QBC47DRAFT_420223 [Echria macrotheca]|uniref:DRBM domain-containing protein n=1 Tax=Echria macrotheca TaxID=438768 RepID=A0AAJ0F8K5_9PEZI|nr:hypothetical protein QBC47DRAFT_420223 [Echria macrotheca]
MVGFYMQYLESLCRRRGWQPPWYEVYQHADGYTCLVVVNGRDYRTDLSYESTDLAKENAAMRAFMVCQNFSVNSGMLARNGIVQGLPSWGVRGGQRGQRTAATRHSTSSMASSTLGSSHHSRERRDRSWSCDFDLGIRPAQTNKT